MGFNSAFKGLMMHGHMNLMCFIFLHDFRWKKIFAPLNIQGVEIEKRANRNVGLHAKYPLCSSDFDVSCPKRANCCKTRQYEIPQLSVPHEKPITVFLQLSVANAPVCKHNDTQKPDDTS